jgi:hypothetical protein
MHPVPGKPVTTPFGKRGQHWSCQKNSSGGIHTGCDIAAPTGTRIVAPIAGTIRHRSYGSAFGSKQFAISPSVGQPFAAGEVFFAHTRTRLKDGTEVQAGDFIAEVAAEGNATGPHLHLEFMPKTKKQWKCGIHADPQPVLDWQPSAPPAPPTPEEPSQVSRIQYHYSGKPAKTQTIGTNYTQVTNGRWVAPGDGWVFAMLYANLSHTKGKTGGVRHVLVRENPTDETCYGDLAVGGGMVSATSFLLQPIWFGAIQKGRPLRWELRRSSSLGTVTAGTRYAKFLWISSDAAMSFSAGRSLPPQPSPWWLWLRSLFSNRARYEILTRRALGGINPDIVEGVRELIRAAAAEGDEPIDLDIP